MCTSLVLQNTNFIASEEMMMKLALENMWHQWHAEPGSLEMKERGKYTTQGSNQKGMGCGHWRGLIGTMNSLMRWFITGRRVGHLGLRKK
jgi:hypothetical protein